MFHSYVRFTFDATYRQASNEHFRICNFHRTQNWLPTRFMPLKLLAVAHVFQLWSQSLNRCSTNRWTRRWTKMRLCRVELPCNALSCRRPYVFTISRSRTFKTMPSVLHGTSKTMHATMRCKCSSRTTHSHSAEWSRSIDATHSAYNCITQIHIWSRIRSSVSFVFFFDSDRIKIELEKFK